MGPSRVAAPTRRQPISPRKSKLCDQPPHLDTGALARHLATDGFGALLGEIDKAALKSGAPFLKSDVSPTLARSQWSYAFEALTRMAALGDAIEAEKGNLSGRGGMEAIERMKTERDALRRAIGSGTIWADGES